MARSSLSAEINDNQVLDLILMRIKGDVGWKMVMAFEISGDGTLQYQERLCVPNIDGLCERILVEAHDSCNVIHPGSMKIYHDLMVMY